MNLEIIEKPFGKWYYSFGDKGILFPKYFETYFTIGEISPVDYVWDDEFGVVVVHKFKDKHLYI